MTQLIYTSATTGKPKPAMRSASALLANILPYAERMRLSVRDVMLTAAPMAPRTTFMY